MKRFIQLTDALDNQPVIVNLTNTTRISAEGTDAKIQFLIDANAVINLYVSESFDRICGMLAFYEELMN